ncbi:MAG: hypothetical protein O3A51_07570 [Verrucomicrobia bacterium]|nr:hypothetical protein [Verrucomicrobiota bacterium]
MALAQIGGGCAVFVSERRRMKLLAGEFVHAPLVKRQTEFGKRGRYGAVRTLRRQQRLMSDQRKALMPGAPSRHVPALAPDPAMFLEGRVLEVWMRHARRQHLDSIAHDVGNATFREQAHKIIGAVRGKIRGGQQHARPCAPAAGFRP